MKIGRTLVEMAQEIERQASAKKDYIAPASALAMVPTEAGPVLELDGVGQLGINPLAHEQLGEWAGIPRAYYKKMQVEKPELLVRNVNTWLQDAPAKTRRMVRVLDGNVRAYLSDSYRPLDYVELAESVLPVLLDLELEVVSAEVTERRLYLKAVDKRINRDIPTGNRMGDGSHQIFDTLSPALIISNSEVGCGSLSIEAGVWTKACTNLAIFAQRSMKKYHLGGKLGGGEDFARLLSDDTRRKTDAALWAQVRDVVIGAFDEAKFDASVAEIRGMVADEITGDVPKVVELFSKKLGVTEGERPSILTHLIKGGDLTRYGLFNAVTRTAEDLKDYDRATDYERMGGKVIELTGNAWREIATAR
jgi:hypothetical protein